MSLRESVAARFKERFGKAPEHLIRSPGRVNLLGEHVDYNGGFVLPISIDRATWLAFSPTMNSRTTLAALDFKGEVTITPEKLREKKDANGNLLPIWALYPAGVITVALNEENLPVYALNACYASNVPVGSGLSSSASVEMAFVLAWQLLGGWTLTPMERALLGQKAENNYVGVNCGIMDQFACACGEEGRLLLLDCRSLEWRTYPLPSDVAVVIADTTIRRTLTSGEYNSRRSDCEAAVRDLQVFLPGIRSLRDVSVETLDRLASHLPDRIQKRTRHVVEEIARSQRAILLLEQGDIGQFGKMLNECHTSLRDLYEVSIHELDVMVRVAQTLPGCYGARLTGAGFGGCTVNLVDARKVDEFAGKLAIGYEAETRLHPEIYICKASQGTEVVN